MVKKNSVVILKIASLHLQLIQYAVLALNYNSIFSPSRTGVVLICFSYAFHLLSSIQCIEKEYMRVVPITQEI